MRHSLPETGFEAEKPIYIWNRNDLCWSVEGIA